MPSMQEPTVRDGEEVQTPFYDLEEHEKKRKLRQQQIEEEDRRIWGAAHDTFGNGAD